MPTRVLSSLQHSDGTFCVKPLKQKQVVSVRVSMRVVAATALHTPAGKWRGAFGERQTPVWAAARPCPAPASQGAWGPPATSKCIDAKRNRRCCGKEGWLEEGAGGWGGLCLCSSPFPCGVAGGRRELPSAGDIWHREQVQHAGLQGMRFHPSRRSSLVLSPIPLAWGQQLKHTRGTSLQHNAELPRQCRCFVLASKLPEAER